MCVCVCVRVCVRVRVCVCVYVDSHLTCHCRRDHPNTVMSPTKHVTISPTSATSVVLSSAGNIVTDDHETVLDVVKDPSIIPLVEPEFSMFGTENGMPPITLNEASLS